MHRRFEKPSSSFTCKNFAFKDKLRRTSRPNLKICDAVEHVQDAQIADSFAQNVFQLVVLCEADATDRVYVRQIRFFLVFRFHFFEVRV